MLTQNFAPCSNASSHKQAGDSSGQPEGALGAVVTTEKIWGKNKTELKVKFLNADIVDKIRVGGERMNTRNILAWANVWNTTLCKEIPRFVLEERKQTQADIRVFFSGICKI